MQNGLITIGWEMIHLTSYIGVMDKPVEWTILPGIWDVRIQETGGTNILPSTM
jgi:hypothetical protein